MKNRGGVFLFEIFHGNPYSLSWFKYEFHQDAPQGTNFEELYLYFDSGYLRIN